MLLLLLIGAGTGTPTPPATEPYQGDVYYYDRDSATGPIAGAAVLPPETNNA